MERRSRKTTSQTIALWVLKVDAAATFAVLGLCGLSIVRSFEGALPYLTTLIRPRVPWISCTGNRSVS